jgi:hypothetical protein
MLANDMIITADKSYACDNMKLSKSKYLYISKDIEVLFVKWR